MSKKLSISDKRKLRKFKLYSEHEFNQLTGAHNRQERLLSAFLDDREEMLNATDFRYLELLRRAFAVMTNELSPALRDKKVMKLLEIPSKRRLRQIKEDVAFLFCNPDDRNIEIERMAMEHKVTRLISRIERADAQAKTLPELYKLLDKLKGTSIHDKKGFKWEEWQLPQPIYTDDINALNHAEDIDHEDIT